MSLVLPRNLQYQGKVQSAAARSKRSNISCQNGAGPYGPSQTIIVNIPTRSNECLATTESYLKGTLVVTNTSGQASSFRLEKCGLHGFISRIRCYSGSNLLEDIQNYNNMAAMLYDIMLPPDCVENKFNILSGSRSNRVTEFAPITLLADTANAGEVLAKVNALLTALNKQIEVSQKNSGSLLGASTANNAATAAFDFAIPLISILGTLNSQQYLPLMELGSAPIRLEIDLVNNLFEAVAQATTGAAVTSTFTLTNVEYVGQFIELSDDAVQIVRGSLRGKPLQYVIPQYKNSTGNIAAVTESNIPLPFKFTSLKSVFVSQRMNTGALNAFPFSSVARTITGYQFRVGSSVMPSKIPSQIPEMYGELCKAIGSIGDIHFNPALTRETYGKAGVDTLDIAADPNINVGQSGSFYIGIDMESYSSANKESLFAGMNTNTQDIYFNSTYGAATTLRYDFYALYDALFVCENGVAYVSV